MIQIDKTKPFLRWVGGKSWLVKHLDQLLPKGGYLNYHEPFLGGGAMFLSIPHNNNNIFLSDLNCNLINTYSALKSDPIKIIKILKSYHNDEDFYYKIREADYGNIYEKAAQFIYLNQTSFNGVYRVNLKGKYNVPYGHRTKNFLDIDGLLMASKKLNSAILFHGDFIIAKENIKKRDLIFLDPPYTVSHNHNGFIKYNEKLFSLDDQLRLSQLIDHIKSIGAYYILTNAAHEVILDIFDKNDKVFTFNRASLIGGLNAKRGQTSEYIFTNTI